MKSDKTLFTQEQIRAWEQLSRRKGNIADGGSQRVAQWEIDEIHGMVERLLAVVSEGTGTLFAPDMRISIAWERYRELIADSQRLKQIEQWAVNNLSFHVSPKGERPFLVAVGENIVAAPDIREAIDIHVRAGA